MNRGKRRYGVTDGTLMVDSTFRRFVGTIGDSLTWALPVRCRTVRGATPADVANPRNTAVPGR